MEIHPSPLVRNFPVDSQRGISAVWIIQMGKSDSSTVNLFREKHSAWGIFPVIVKTLRELTFCAIFLLRADFGDQPTVCNMVMSAPARGILATSLFNQLVVFSRRMMPVAFFQGLSMLFIERMMLEIAPRGLPMLFIDVMLEIAFQGLSMLFIVRTMLEIGFQ